MMVIIEMQKILQILMIIMKMVGSAKKIMMIHVYHENNNRNISKGNKHIKQQ